MKFIKSRKQLENELEVTIRIAEKTALKSPKVKSMVDQLRSMYQNNQSDFLNMMGVPPPDAGAAPKRAKVPSSNIPQLLVVLDSLAKKESVPLPPGKHQFKNNAIPPILSQTTLEKATSKVKPVSQVYAKTVELSTEKRKEIDVLSRDIEKARETLRLVRQDESLIKAKKGKYGIVVERLKAERILREYPEMITHMTNKKKLLEEGIL